jgi:PASTA domain
MGQVQRIPYKGSGTLGRGVNILTGETLGKALNVMSKEQVVSGGEATYECQITETHDSLMEALGLSVAASGRYGMFSAEGKFKLSEASRFNATSTFVVASCRVQNAFEMVDRVQLSDEAKPLLENPEKFRTAFGTSFVRGLQTGGEFYIVLQVTSTNQETQSSLSAAFQADCQALVSSGSFEAAYNQAKGSTSSKTQISVLMYQRSGQDYQLSFVSQPSAVIQRLKDFPAIARANPCGYECEVADYNTLPLPEVNMEEVLDREMSLADCARLRLKYITRRNDIEFARENRTFFVDLATDENLSDWWAKYSRAVALVQLHAQRIAGRKIAPTVFDIKAADPDLDLPLVNFRRVNVPSDIPVPLLKTYKYAYAKEQLTALGLQGEGRPIAVAATSGQPLDIIMDQEPASGTLVPPKTRVLLTYNYVPSEGGAYIRPREWVLHEISTHGFSTHG